jgi:hypothetical protein
MNFAYVLFGIISISSLLVAFLFWRVVGAALQSLEDAQVSSWFRRSTLGLVLWAIVGTVLAVGLVFRTPELLNINPAFLLVPSIFIPVFINILLLRSARQRQLVDAVRLEHITLIHTLRAVIGSGFLGLYALGYLPSSFALEAGLGDIAIGLTAIPVAVALHHKAKYALTLAALWNVLGMLDLLNALRLGVGGLVPFATGTQTPLLIGIVPLLGVPLYVIWHVYGLRILWREVKARAALLATPANP